MKGFAKIGKTVTDRTKYEVPQDSADMPAEEEEAFEKLKEVLKAHPTLALPRREG